MTPLAGPKRFAPPPHEKEGGGVCPDSEEAWSRPIWEKCCASLEGTGLCCGMKHSGAHILLRLTAHR